MYSGCAITEGTKIAPKKSTLPMRNFAATLVACIVSLITAKPANVILILTDDQSDAFSSTDLEVSRTVWQ